MKFSDLTVEELSEAVVRRVADHRRTRISFVNPEIVIQSRQSNRLAEYIESVDYAMADGIGVVWASRLLCERGLRARATGTDFVPAICRVAASSGLRLFFFGGQPGIAAQASVLLAAQFPGLQVVGVHDGANPWVHASDVVEAANKLNADVLMVCLGTPRQEQWIEEFASGVNAPVVFGNGGALDFWSGLRKRAPAALRAVGMEWLWRFAQEPTLKRFLRQLRLPRFVLSVLGSYASSLVRSREKQ